MIAVDTNVLVHARRSEMKHHKRAARLLLELAEGSQPWAIPWPCVYEFLRVVTHPRVFAPPTELDVALEDLESLFASPSLSLLGAGPAHPSHLLRLATQSGATGNLVHDVQIAALVLEHGVTELLTLDRDFARFPGIKVRNPFAA